MMSVSRHFGPYDDLARAWQEAEAAGFSVASRDSVLTVSRIAEDPVEEDASAWVGTDHLARLMLVVDLPGGNAGSFPGYLDLTKVPNFERQSTWPIWTERVSVGLLVPDANDQLLAKSEAAALLRAPAGGFEFVARIEMLGVGRAGKSEVIIHQPIRSHTLIAAQEALARSVPLAI